MGIVHLKWNPFDLTDPGPCIDVTVMNSSDILSAWRADGLDCPEPVKMKALLDTGASITAISKTYASYCKLRQTGEGSKIMPEPLVFPGQNCGNSTAFVSAQ